MGEKQHLLAILNTRRPMQRLWRKGIGDAALSGKQNTPNDHFSQRRRAEIVAKGGEPPHQKNLAVPRPTNLLAHIFFNVAKKSKTAWHHDLQADCILTAICGDPKSIWSQVSRSRKVKHSTLGSAVLTQRKAMRKYSVRRRAHLQNSSSLAPKFGTQVSEMEPEALLI